MRIAIWYNLPSGGGKRALHDQVRGLAEAGHDLEFWCPSTADRSFLPLDPFGPEHVVPFEPRPTAGGRTGRLLGDYLRTAADIEAMDRLCRQCAEAMDAGGFDLLFATSCALLAAPTIARHSDLPSVLYLQEPFRIHYEAREYLGQIRLPWIAREPHEASGGPRIGIPLLDGLLARKWRLNFDVRDLARIQGMRVHAREELRNARAFDAILCNSIFSRENIQRAYGLRATVCYLGIDCDRFGTASTKEPYVVGVGSIHSAKRIEVALRAIATIDLAERPGLVWIGNSSDPFYLRNLRRMARELAVEFEPHVLVRDEELAGHLGRAAVMAYAPLLEPFGYAPLEANACGTAVIGYAEGGLRETIRNGVNGELFEPGDDAALGRALLRYTSDLDYARDCGGQARRHVVETWGLQAARDRLAQCLEDVLESRAVHGAASVGG